MPDQLDNSQDSYGLADSAESPVALVPGWMLLISGMAILGATVMVPAWIESQHLGWQLDVMQRQTQALSRQVDAYRTFHQAVLDQDPLVLRRLAYHQLRARPTGAQLLLAGEARSASPASPASSSTTSFSTDMAELADMADVNDIHDMNDMPAPLVRPQSRLERTDHGSFIEAWLHQPLPRVGEEIAPFRVTATRLIRLTTGPPRLIVALFGVVCLLAGLMFDGQGSERRQQERES